MKNEDLWLEALRLLHKFIPQSKSVIIGLENLNIENVYKLVKVLNSESERKIIKIEESSKVITEVCSSELLNKEGRVLVIPDLQYWEIAPIVCNAKSLVERLEEGVLFNINDQNQHMEFIGNGDSLFVFESDGTLIMIDHEDGLTMVNSKEENA